MKCVYCGRSIWPWQSRAPETNGYIHDNALSPNCKFKKWTDNYFKEMDEAYNSLGEKHK